MMNILRLNKIIRKMKNQNINKIKDNLTGLREIHNNNNN